MKGSVFFDNVWKFISEHSEEFVSTIIILLFCIIVIMVGYIVQKKYSANKRKKKFAVLLAQDIFSFFRGFVIVVCSLIILSIWGANFNSLLIGFAIFFLAVALGSRQMITDIIRGLEINFSNYFDIDDVVEINGFIGYVKEINLKTTKLLNTKNEYRTFPNGEIREFTNYSKFPHVTTLEIIILNDNHIKKAIEILEDNISKNDDKFENIIEGPNILGVTDVLDNTTIIKITYKAKYDITNNLLTELKLFVKEILKDNNIPFKFYDKENK